MNIASVSLADTVNVGLADTTHQLRLIHLSHDTSVVSSNHIMT